MAYRADVPVLLQRESANLLSSCGRRRIDALRDRRHLFVGQPEAVLPLLLRSSSCLPEQQIQGQSKRNLDVQAVDDSIRVLIVGDISDDSAAADIRQDP